MLHYQDITHETCKGTRYELVASFCVHVAEPDVGLLLPTVEIKHLYWAYTGKELSKSAYSRLTKSKIWEDLRGTLETQVFGY